MGGNASDGRRNLRSVASRTSHYGRTRFGASEAAQAVSDAHMPQQKARPTDAAPVGEMETRTDTKLALGRRKLQRAPEKTHPEGNGGLSSVPTVKVPSVVLQHMSLRALRKNTSVVSSTHRAQQLLNRARSRLQGQKEKVVKQVAKKLAASPALSSSATAAATSPEGGSENVVDSNDTSMPPSVEQDEEEVGEASEVEEEGEQPRKVKIKLPDSKVPSESLSCAAKFPTLMCSNTYMRIHTYKILEFTRDFIVPIL